MHLSDVLLTQETALTIFLTPTGNPPITPPPIETLTVTALALP